VVAPLRSCPFHLAGHNGGIGHSIISPIARAPHVANRHLVVCQAADAQATTTRHLKVCNRLVEHIQVGVEFGQAASVARLHGVNHERAITQKEFGKLINFN